ncbi:MAG: hypothetical protein JWP18_323 [Solirubrobacterales bacterium]|jgi:hypothetical protein|nr:hypothetical protein [Solirubrobacterales bacterium]
MLPDRLRPALLLTVTAVAFLSAVPSGQAATRYSCHSGGSKVIKRTADGILYAKPRPAEGIVYTACSTRFGKRVRLGSDASALVDYTFTIKSARVSSYSAKLVYCSMYDSGWDRYTVTADLVRGRVTTRTEPVTGDAC